MGELSRLIALLSASQLDDVTEFVMRLLDHSSPTEISIGIVCPECGSVHCVRNGRVRERQRYMCKDCGRSFGTSNKTSLFCSKLPAGIWRKYIPCLINGCSVRKAAEIVGVSVKTSFYMRHRILDAIRALMDRNRVGDVVEMDETFFAESFKGNHSRSSFKLPRPARKRGRQVKKRGLSREQICVGTAIDRSNNVIMGILCRGRVTTASLKGLYTRRIAEETTICTDSAAAYQQFATAVNAALKAVPTGKHKVEGYNLGRVNSLHSSLKTWMRRFYGVATKHLANYLAWFTWLAMNRDTSHNSLPQRMMNDMMSQKVDARIKIIRQREVKFAA